MKLTARIRSARDGWLAVEVLEIPELEVVVKSFEDIPDAVSGAAEKSLGRPASEFVVEVSL